MWPFSSSNNSGQQFTTTDGANWTTYVATAWRISATTEGFVSIELGDLVRMKEIEPELAESIAAALVKAATAARGMK